MDYSTWGERELVEELRRRDYFRDELIRIYDYMLEAERDHYRESGFPNGHIFEAVEELGDLLELPSAQFA